MSKKEEIEAHTEQLLLSVTQEKGLSIYDVEYIKEAGDWYLRAYIDKPGGININDCVDVSHALSDALDKEDFIEDAYTLEVSSPGLGRQLKKDRHFVSSIGREVDLKTYMQFLSLQERMFHMGTKEEEITVYCSVFPCNMGMKCI